uniref:Proteasome subunit beta n=1 Tax=Philasterides dicentrarchi TaxID=282688 RepID=A0A411PX45_9CILI|nr:20S proteasome subunit beta 4 [Philasterides dicentrarchi]
MDSSFGIQGKDFVLIAADSAVLRSIMKLHDDEDKISVIGGNKIMSLSGESSDRLQFGTYVEKNLNLFKYRNSNELSTLESVNFIRSELATALRKGPYQVNILFGGFDEEGPGLYFIDYLGTKVKTHIGAHGYASHFTLGLLEHYYQKDLTQEQGIKIIKQCINELKSRFLVNQPFFKVKMVTKDGVKEIDVSK